MKLLLIYFLFHFFSFSQSSNQEIKINKVSVRGNIITSENTILFTAGIKGGEYVSPIDFPRAIKRLWKLGLFQDIQIEYEEESSKGLSIIIVVSENYVLNEVLYSGNKKVKNTKLDELLSFSDGQRIKPNTLKKAEEAIKKLYAEKGFLNVQVNSSLVIPKGKSNFIWR